MKIQITHTFLFLVVLLNLIASVSAAPREYAEQDVFLGKSENAKQIPALADRDKNGLSDRLQHRMGSMKAGDFVDVIVTFSGRDNGLSHVNFAEQAVGAFSNKREFSIIHGFKATMTVSQAQALSRVPGVFRVEEDAVVTTQLSGASSDFGAVTARSNSNVNGDGIGICIVDTGIDPGHEQFANRTIHFFDATDKAVIAPYDDHGHGTHVAAIALGGGGIGNNSNIIGVAPEAEIYSAKVLDALGSGSESQVIAGIDYCASQADVHIISMSLGTGGASDGQDALSLVVNCVSASNYSDSCNVTPVNPKIVVVAAGNSGPGPSSIGSPGAAEKAITVGAVSNWSEDGRGVYLVAFSSRGPTLDGRIKPDISAPGVRITSAKAGTKTGYVSYSGTSMATPFISGAVALMLQSNLVSIMDDTVPADSIRELLASSAQDRGELGLNDNPIKPDNEYGAGILDVNRAVALAGGNDTTPTVFPSYQVMTGSINNSGRSQFFGPFTITEADIIAGIPFSATVTIEGTGGCAYDELFGEPGWCDFLGFGWEWSPDLDVFLVDDSANFITGGTGDITASECALSGEACGISRQETIHYLPPTFTAANAAGDYWIEVASFSGSGDFLLEVSQGPMNGIPETPPNVAPVAGFTYSTSGLTANFSDTSIDTLPGTVIGWFWDFGDESSSSLQNPSHTYAAFGTFEVKLTVTDNDDATDDFSKDVTVSAPEPEPINAPTADFSYGTSGLEVTFLDISREGDNSIDSWFWEFGDGNSSTNQSPVHEYGSTGSYTVKLTVKDEGNASSDTTGIVQVFGPPLAPSNLTVSVDVSGKGKNKMKSVTLNWLDNSLDENKFIIERCQETGRGSSKICNFLFFFEVESDVKTFSDETDGGTYKYRVKADNLQGDSAYSNEVKI